ncbi:hypothetical protein [Brevibacillus sp. NRS-1366]|uniref:hypothetical protein n=1 Tax=Brevibacillus sp. NRS-1366 TaxID=3233899 RepID=UPI003D207CB4
MLRIIGSFAIIFGIVIGLTAFSSPKTFSSEMLKIQDPTTIGKDQIKQWIQQQSKKKDHYFEHLTFQTTNLDDDDALEVVATLTGGVHIGSFFLFDKQENGQYQLLTEQPWKIEKLDLEQPITYLHGKKLYQTVHRTGGTGVSVEIAVLWFMDKGQLVEAWSGTLKETSTFQDEYYAQLGSYHIFEENLHYFTTTYKRSVDDTKTPSFFKQASSTFTFNGTIFESLIN